METRDLLSVTLPGYALPDHAAINVAEAASLSTQGPTGYSPAQIRHAYGFDQITFNNGTVTGDGGGTTIAIVDAFDDPTIANDLTQFDAKYGLPNPVFTKISQTGSQTVLPQADHGWASEIALDVEWAHAIAPKASILLVEANDNSYTNLFAAVDKARSTAGVVAVSMSWGGGEFFGETAYDSHFTTPSGHAGVTFVASSGDSGAPPGYPAISPNVVAVGGTTLNLDSSGNDLGESSWSGSGGGISAVEGQPSYQNGRVTQSTTRRTNPDVAYDANPNTGFSVYDSYDNPLSAPWAQWGGTSDAAPQWAALFAIADQGLALAGKGPLDGPSQTLPALYSLPSGDFHDILGGGSGGSPPYSATAGYDLVTGRGSPHANLVVQDLVGSSATAVTPHFSVSAPTSDTAGSSFSITVSALDSFNKPVTGYRGTVQFTSSDGMATLPSAYTFSSNDNGVHTFSGLVLKTAGSQSITVTDTAASAIVASATITINPALADHLAFVQQPGTAAPGALLSPAVTVKVLDLYGNPLTGDNSDQVTLTLGSNTGGGTLGGTTTVTVSRGLATFGNLSISAAGSGYTLVANSTGLKSATSNSFNVTTSTLIEGFETSAVYNIVGATSPSAWLSAAAAHDGTLGLVDAPGNDWVYRSDPAAQVKQGETISVWLQFNTAADGRAYFAFGASATGTLSLVAAPNSNQLLLQNNSGYGFSNIGAVSQSYLANHWYRLEVDWGSTGNIVGKLFDSDGTTLLQTVKATTNTITAGGVGFRAIGVHNKYWDTVTMIPGAGSAAVKTIVVGQPPVGGSTGTSHGPGRFADARQRALAAWYSRFGSEGWGSSGDPTHHANDVPAAFSNAVVDELLRQA